MRREILLATAGLSVLALVAACDNKKNEPSPTPSPSAQTDESTGTSATKSKKTASAGSEESGYSTTTPGAENEVSDIGFAKNAAIGDMYEINASRMALERSQSEPVKRFAQDMIDAHSKTTTDLKGTLPPSTVQMLPADLDIDHQNMIQELRNASDEDFDRLYLAQQREAHEQALALFRSYADNGTEARLKQFAQDTLPAIESHKDKVASLSTPKKVALKSKKSRKE